MPVVKDTADLPVQVTDGVTETLVAGPAVFGAPVPMRMRRVALERGRTAALDAGGAEVMAYVVAGGGAMAVAGERHELAPESMAWIEPGPFELEAGDEGLVVLVAEAPDPGR